jgi:hypothetical protein
MTSLMQFTLFFILIESSINDFDIKYLKSIWIESQWFDISKLNQQIE